jgi:Uma2 family endonuclease
MPSRLAPAFGRLPTHLDLPSTDDQPVENNYQTWQTFLLFDTIDSHMERLHPDGQYLLAADMGIYYQITDPPLNGCKAPDWFYVPNVPPTLPDSSYRRSYVMWQELVRPAVVIEFVSDITRGQEHDRTPERGKFWVYEQVIAVAYYIIYDPAEVKLEVYRMAGSEYELMQPDDSGSYYIQPLRLNIGLRFESYKGLTLNWLRWFDTKGEMLESGKEKFIEERLVSKRERQRAKQAEQRAEQEKQRAEQEKQRAEQEKQRAEQEKLRADRAMQKLRELGIDPEQA